MSIDFSGDPPRRGEIFWADLNPARGSEQAGHRPVLVISSTGFNRQMSVVVTAAMTRTVRASVRDGRSPVSVFLPEGQPMDDEGAVLCFQITTLDQNRLEESAGELTPGQMRQVDRAIAASFGLTEWVGRRT